MRYKMSHYLLFLLAGLFSSIASAAPNQTAIDSVSVDFRTNK